MGLLRQIVIGASVALLTDRGQITPASANLERQAGRTEVDKNPVFIAAPGFYTASVNQIAAFQIAAALGFLAVALGAFGAHGLSDTLNRHGTAAIWDKAVLYHLVHTVMLMLLARLRPWQPGPWFCFLAGILVFSGSLYVLAGTNTRWLGAITPLGGVSFLAGWLWLAGRAARSE